MNAVPTAWACIWPATARPASTHTATRTAAWFAFVTRAPPMRPPRSDDRRFVTRPPLPGTASPPGVQVLLVGHRAGPRRFFQGPRMEPASPGPRASLLRGPGRPGEPLEPLQVSAGHRLQPSVGGPQARRVGVHARPRADQPRRARLAGVGWWHRPLLLRVAAGAPGVLRGARPAGPPPGPVGPQRGPATVQSVAGAGGCAGFTNSPEVRLPERSMNHTTIAPLVALRQTMSFVPARAWPPLEGPMP